MHLSKRRGLILGGGFGGVYVAVHLGKLLSRRERAEIEIRGDRILPELTESLATFAHRLLAQRGVEIRLGAGLKAVSAEAVVIEDKATGRTETLGTRTVVATVPAGPHPLLSQLAVPQTRGRITVEPTTAVLAAPGLWAIGDCAAVPQVDGQMSPPTAQHALRQARTCAENIVATLRGRPRKTFTFTGLGKLGSLGRRPAVAEIFGLRLKGLFAWLLWRGVYVTKFPGLSGQIPLLTDWVLDAVLPRDINQLRLFHEEPVHREHFEPGERVFGAGNVGDKVYFIVTGEATVSLGGKMLAALRAGDVFGETALLSDQPRNAEVRAQTALNVVVVSREAFHELLRHVPGVQASMQRITASRAAANPDAEKKSAKPV